MLAGLVALLGLGIWQGRHWLPDLLSHAKTASVAPAAKPPTGPSSETAVKKTRLARGKTAKPEFAALDRLAAVPGGSTVVVVPVPSMPTSSNIKTGTSRNDLRARYGDPSLNVSARRDGRLVERYYYLSEDQTLLTVATLQDGTVTSTKTVSR